MYELINAKGNSYYIESPAKVGLYRLNETEVCLIDSGSDKDAGKKIQKILAANGWTLKFIISTHSNADHVGGCRLLCDRLGCTVYTTPMEGAVNRFPVLEPTMLYGGYPMKALRNKFLMAQSCPGEDIAGAPLPEGMEIIKLGGHFLDMIGVKTPDGVYYLADCLSGANIVEKYHVNFIYDVREYLQTLDCVEGLGEGIFIPAHAEMTTDIRPLVEINRAKVREIIAYLIELTRAPKSPEEIQSAVFEHYGLEMNMNQYVLVGSTLRSYMAYLADENMVSFTFENGRLMWQAM